MGGISPLPDCAILQGRSLDAWHTQWVCKLLTWAESTWVGWVLGELENLETQCAVFYTEMKTLKTLPGARLTLAVL